MPMNPELARNQDKIEKIRSLFREGLLLKEEVDTLQGALSLNTVLLRPGVEIPRVPPPPQKTTPEKENGQFTKLTQEDIDKIGESTIPPDDPRLTKQDVMLMKKLMKKSDYTNIVDIAREINPMKRDYEIQYLLMRLPTLNTKYLSPVGLRITYHKDDEGLLRIVQDREIKNPESSLLFANLKVQNELMDREKNHIDTVVTKNAKGIIIEATTPKGKLDPILLKTIHIREFPANAITDEQGNGMVLVHEDEKPPIMQKVKPITYTISSSQQVKLIQMLLSEGAISQANLFVRFTNAEELFSYRNAQLLVHCVNKNLRAWGVEAFFDEIEENLSLQVMGKEKPTIPENPVRYFYETDTNRYLGKKRLRKPNYQGEKI